MVTAEPTGVKVWISASAASKQHGCETLQAHFVWLKWCNGKMLRVGFHQTLWLQVRRFFTLSSALLCFLLILCVFVCRWSGRSPSWNSSSILTSWSCTTSTKTRNTCKLLFRGSFQLLGLIFYICENWDYHLSSVWINDFLKEQGEKAS